MWKQLRWRLFGTATVSVVMFDGSIKLSLAKKIGQRWYAAPWSFFDIATYRLNPDGTVVGDSLVKSWRPVIGDVPFREAA